MNKDLGDARVVKKNSVLDLISDSVSYPGTTETAADPATGAMNDSDESFSALPGESDQMRRGRSYTADVGSGGLTAR
jgi:hypothetical protein